MFPGRRARPAHAAALICLAMILVWLAGATLPSDAAARSARTAILPPQNPEHSLGIGKYVPPSCSGVRDLSAACLKESLAMINAGRRSEDLGPVVLPSNWDLLTVAQQLFVLTDLERTARGLPADPGLTTALNGVAMTGAAAGRDPTAKLRGFAALWAGGDPNSIAVMADWVYEDGFFADGFTPENLNCSRATPAGCWQHRDILLHDAASSPCGLTCDVGAGYSPDGYSHATDTGRDSYAEVVARSDGGTPAFTWAAERDQLPICERAGDTCAWAGNPVATAAGIVTVGGTRAVTDANTSSDTKPWFSLSVTGQMGGRGHVTLKIHVGIRLIGMTAVAQLDGRRRPFRVQQLSDHVYQARGRLSAGTWTVTIRYHPLRTRRRRPTSWLHITVPTGT